MPKLTSNAIRQQFLDFFKSKAHDIVPSSPVVPYDDPTLLFTNAGMNQFKPIFLGTVSPNDPHAKMKRAADTQKCIRAGGKHNDLDDVGKDTYHHTFFEMLGNWSFGDYFKKEAIEWAWELLTKVWKIDKSRLHATYFQGDESEGLEPDGEAAALWRTVTDIDPSHVHPGNKKDNFWEMGDTGPCGPCSEIHIDLTPDKSGGHLVNAGDARVMEIWNLVFIQFNRGSDGKLTPLPAKHVDTGMGFERISSVLQSMEADRLGNFSNYDTDVFTPIFQAIQKRTNAPAYQGTLPTDVQDPNDPQSTIENRQSTIMVDVTYRVIADHLRCVTFALTDGAVPSNEGRGYVLRRILRRGVRYGRQYLNMHEPFMCDLVASLVQNMGDVFPELRTGPDPKRPRDNAAYVAGLIREEEASFLKTLDRGISLFEKAAAFAAGNAIAFDRGWTFQAASPQAWTQKEEAVPGIPPANSRWTLAFLRNANDPASSEMITLNSLSKESISELVKNTPVIAGEDCFKLHDTFGFPIDLVQLMADERGVIVDVSGYEALVEKSKTRAREASRSHKSMAIWWHDLSREMLQKQTTATTFVGQDSRSLQASSRLQLIVKGANVSEFSMAISEGEEGIIVLDTTPFYPEKGGQIGDEGTVKSSIGEFEVIDAQEIAGRIIHIGRCTRGMMVHYAPDFVKGLGENAKLDPSLGTIEAYSELVSAQVDEDFRIPTTKNHTATHIMNWALREVLGDHVQQKGSLVDPEKTRFDLSHPHPISNGELARIEKLTNEQVTKKLRVYAASNDEDYVDQAEALKIKTLRAVFGEKYPARVRVVSIGAPITEKDAREAGESDWLLRSPDDAKWMKYSVEFCGGTHVDNSSKVERFVIVSEEGVAKGVRRVVGVTGETARKAHEEGQRMLREANELVGSATRTGSSGDGKAASGPHGGPYDLASRVSALTQSINDAVIPILVRHELREKIAELQKIAKQHEKQSAAASGDAVMDKVKSLHASAQTVGGVTVVVGEVPAAPVDALRGAIDWIRQKSPSSAVLLAMVDDNRVTLLAGMSKDVVDRGVKAGDLIKEISPLVGGKGGGRPDMAQGGGTDAGGLPKAIEAASQWIAGILK